MEANYNSVVVLPYIDLNPSWVYMYSPSWTPLPPPSPCHPSGSSQCTSPEYPVSCIKPGLAIHFTYDILHVSMPFSQIIPPFQQETQMYRTGFWTLRKAFLSFLAILWNSAFKQVYLSFSPLLFASLLFTAICKTSSDWT